MSKKSKTQRKTQAVVETKPRVEEKVSRDILESLDKLINVNTKENIHKRIVVDKYNELAGKNYVVSREYSKLYKSIKYNEDKDYAMLEIPLNKRLITSRELYDKLVKLRTIVRGNLVSLLIISDIGKFINSLNRVECSEVKDYVDCGTVDKTALAITKKETSGYITIEVYLKLNDNILVDITKFIRKK